MSEAFEKVKNFVLNLGLPILEEDEKDEILVISDEADGLSRLVIDCEAPLVVLEQPIMRVKGSLETYKRLLQMNRTLVHGAFALDDSGTQVVFRDTLQLGTLDETELEASVDALIVAVAEYGNELLSLAQGGL